MLRKKGSGAAGEGVVVVKLSGPAGGGDITALCVYLGTVYVLDEGRF